MELEGEFEEQTDLLITREADPVITVDNIKVAQIIYLILNNEEIRDVLNTLTSKSVLILGRFTIPERKVILNALKNKLREYNLLPIVFDFDRPTDKDFTETIKTLAGLYYFVIADIIHPKSSTLELQATVPDLSRASSLHFISLLVVLLGPLYGKQQTQNPPVLIFI